jgi:hypothetical protein
MGLLAPCGRADRWTYFILCNLLRHAGTTSPVVDTRRRLGVLGFSQLGILSPTHDESLS